MKALSKLLRIARSQAGLSMIEIILASGLATGAVIGGVTLMNFSGGLQKNTEGQSIVDRELAAGTQLANNPQKLAPFLDLGRLGDCLTQDQSGGCAKFAAEGWKPYPADTGAAGPSFQTSFGQNGPCGQGSEAKDCIVKREMFHRFLCTSARCTGVETRVLVSPQNALADKIRPRETTIKLDRRQFLSRAQLEFLCDANQRSIAGVDYAQLSDICKINSNSRCDLPHKTYQPSAGDDCREELDATCSGGFSSAGLDGGSGGCAPAAGGRSVAGRSTATDTATNTVTGGSTETIINTEIRTNSQTNTATATNQPTRSGRWKFNHPPPGGEMILTCWPGVYTYGSCAQGMQGGTPPPIPVNLKDGPSDCPAISEFNQWISVANGSDAGPCQQTNSKCHYRTPGVGASSVGACVQQTTAGSDVCGFTCVAD